MKSLIFLLHVICLTSAQFLPLKTFDITTKTIYTKKNREKMFYNDSLSPGSKINPIKEEKLLKYLLKDYNPNILPKMSLDEYIKVFFGL